jgi:hypothetical protein
MDARMLVAVRSSTAAALLACWLISALTAVAAPYATTNFRVVAPTPELAKEIGEAAEKWRRELAIEWIGEEMPPWYKPCPIKAKVSPNIGAGGVTTFVFDRGQVFNWNMEIQGTRERVLDSVLPHEITHTIFACYFRQPLPRWADEGACTTVEHPSEIAKQEDLLIQFLKSGKGIAFRDMFAMKEYPSEVLPLYAQGHSLTRYLIGQKGKAHFLKFLGDGMADENWPRAVREYYGHESLYALQTEWLDWVRQGRPLLAGELKSVPSQIVQASTAGGATAGERAAPGEGNPSFVLQTGGTLPVSAPAARPGVDPQGTPDQHESAYSKGRVLRR